MSDTSLTGDAPILVLGAGMVGTAVARQALAAGRHVVVLCRRQSSAQAAADELGLAQDDVWFADLTEEGAVPQTLAGRRATDGDDPLTRLAHQLLCCDVVDATSVSTSFADAWLAGGDGWELACGRGASLASARGQRWHALLASGTVRRLVRVSTTGLGAWGLNVPFTHGDKQRAIMSPALWLKLMMAGMDHQILWALSRSFGSRVALVVPAAFVGFEADEMIATDPAHLAGATVAAGEDRSYTAEELAVLSSRFQMGAVARAEVAAAVIGILSGTNAAADLLGAIRNASLSGSAQGDSDRRMVLAAMRRRSGPVAQGALGPETSKALILLRAVRLRKPYGQTDTRTEPLAEDVLAELRAVAAGAGLTLGAHHGDDIDVCLCDDCLDRASSRMVDVLRKRSQDFSLEPLTRELSLSPLSSSSWAEGDVLALLWARQASSFEVSPFWPRVVRDHEI